MQPNPGDFVSYQPPYQGGQHLQPIVSPGPYPAPGYYPAAGPQYIQPLRVVPTSGWATASLVLGLIGLFGGWCLIGIPCALAVVACHIGLSQTKDGVRAAAGARRRAGMTEASPPGHLARWARLS